MKPPILPRYLRHAVESGGELTVYTVYKTGNDAGGAIYTVRVWRAAGGAMAADPEELLTGRVDAAWGAVPREADWRLGRRRDDDPSIVESFI